MANNKKRKVRKQPTDTRTRWEVLQDDLTRVAFEFVTAVARENGSGPTFVKELQRIEKAAAFNVRQRRFAHRMHAIQGLARRMTGG